MKSTVHATFALLAVAAGMLTAVARNPDPPPAADETSAGELAQWIHDRKPGLLVVDARPAQAGERDRLPGARTLSEVDPGMLDAADTLVVYADSRVDGPAVDALRARSGARRILRLHGGVAAWNEDVLFPVLRADASPRQQREFAPRALLSRYFGGSPRLLDPGASAPRGRSRRGC
jgi:hypothetical protein